MEEERGHIGAVIGHRNLELFSIQKASDSVQSSRADHNWIFKIVKCCLLILSKIYAECFDLHRIFLRFSPKVVVDSIRSWKLIHRRFWERSSTRTDLGGNFTSSTQTVDLYHSTYVFWKLFSLFWCSFQNVLGFITCFFFQVYIMDYCCLNSVVFSVVGFVTIFFLLLDAMWNVVNLVRVILSPYLLTNYEQNLVKRYGSWARKLLIYLCVQKRNTIAINKRKS